MRVSEKIKYLIDNNGLKQKWIASKIAVPNNTLSYKLSNNTFSAEELLKIGVVLNIDLNKLAKELYGELK